MSLTKEEMELIFERFFGSRSEALVNKQLLESSAEDFAKNVKRMTEEFQKSIPVHRRVLGALTGQTVQYNDFKKEIQNTEEQLKELEKAFKDTSNTAAKGEIQEKRRHLEEFKREQERMAGHYNLRNAIQNTTVGIFGIAKTIVDGAFNIAGKLQAGAGGIEAGSAVLTEAITAGAKTVKVLSGAFDGLGIAVALLTRNPWVKALGIALELIGKLVGAQADAAAELAKKTNDYLTNELKKTEDSFKAVANSGVVLAGGMTELRQLAAVAGLDVSMLARAVTQAREDLNFMGLGAGQAARRLAGVSNAIMGSELEIQLRNLGLAPEQMLEVSAMVMANQKAAGDQRILSDREVARLTGIYARDLKVLSDLTGQDAKKAMERARLESLRAEAMGKLTVQQRENLTQVLSATDPKLHTAILQQVISGQVTDLNTLVASQQAPAIMDFIRSASDLVKNATDSEGLSQVILEERGRLRTAMEQHFQTYGAAINEATLISNNVSGVLRGAADLTNSLLQNTQFTEEAARNSRRATEEMFNNTNALDRNVQTLNQATLALQSAIGQTLTPVITEFASVLQRAIKTVDEALKDVGLVRGKDGKIIIPEANQKASLQGGALADPRADAEAMALGFGARAQGGPVAAFKTYLVGERGPELFKPDTSGQIISNQDMASMGAAGSTNTVVEILAKDLKDMFREQIMLHKMMLEQSQDSTSIMSDLKSIQQQLLNSSI